jgi:carbon-monoxide dehydrogenase small subunit
VVVKLEVNGEPRSYEGSPWKRLLDVLREDLRLTGTKEGCGEGECGACTVLLDGEAVNACLVAVGQCDGRRVTTVEGLARGDVLHAVQRALVACGGAQCGICTPGIAVCATYVVDRGLVRGLGSGGRAAGEGSEVLVPDGERSDAHPAKDEAGARAAVRELLAGNICRCTGYQLIVDAVIDAARELAGGEAARELEGAK